MSTTNGEMWLIIENVQLLYNLLTFHKCSKTMLVCGTIAGTTDGSHADGVWETSEKEITDSRNCKYSRQIAAILRHFWHIYVNLTSFSHRHRVHIFADSLLQHPSKNGFVTFCSSSFPAEFLWRMWICIYSYSFWNQNVVDVFTFRLEFRISEIRRNVAWLVNIWRRWVLVNFS